MNIERTVLEVEILSADGHCPQACSHCVQGVNARSPQEEKTFFGNNAIVTLQQLEHYLRSKGDPNRKRTRLSSLGLATGLAPQNLNALPLTTFPESVSFILGDALGELQSGDIAETLPRAIDTIVETVKGSLGNLRPDPEDQAVLSFSIISKLGGTI